MIFFDQFSLRHDNDAASQVPEAEEVEVFPLTDIPVGIENPETDMVHDGTFPCGEPDCPCATYGYDVPSLHDPRLP